VPGKESHCYFRESQGLDLLSYLYPNTRYIIKTQEEVNSAEKYICMLLKHPSKITVFLFTQNKNRGGMKGFGQPLLRQKP